MSPKKPLILLTLLFVAMLSTCVLAVTENGSMKIYAVTTEGEGLVATLHLQIEPGNGKIWSAVTPLVGTSTQNAERTAVAVARKFYPNGGFYDYKYSIDSAASVVDGPSAGAAMTLLTTSMLLDRAVPANVSITGTIKDNGDVGAVGGIFEKAQEASKTGVKLFMIPKGEAVQTVKLPEGVKSVNLVEYAPQAWGLKVVEVDTIEQALDFANSNISDINAVVSGGQNAAPDFVPDKIPISPELTPFKALTTNYINETKQATSEAQNALSSTLIEDPTMTHSLLEVLNAAEQMIDKAEILNEQNYLYSAANFAFLARVNATVVKEISNNPKLLEEDSGALDIRVFNLKKELDNFGDDLDANPPKSGIEWLASAQQRYTYAKIAVEKLSTQQTIVVGGNADDKILVAFERVQDYAFAAEWLGVAEDFYDLSKQEEKFVKRPGTFANSMDLLIAGSESDINAITEPGQAEDIARRIDSAKVEKASGWYEASYFDAASARAMIDSEIAIAGKDNGQLRQMLVQKIADIERMSSGPDSLDGWGKLYLDHAKYYLSAADYYEDQNYSGTAGDNLASGYSLALLSEGVLKVANEVNAAYAALPETQEHSNGNSNGNSNPIVTVQNPNGFTSVAIVLLLVALILVLTIMLVGMMNSQKHRKFSILKEISNTKKGIKEVDDAYMKGKIDSETHERLLEKNSEELAFLENERKKKAMHILAMDNFSTEVASYNAKLRDLRKHLKEGVITSDEYSEKSKEYLAKIGELKNALHSEIDEISKVDVEAKGGKGTSMLPVVVGKEELVAVSKPGSLKAQKPAKKPSKSKKGGAGIRDIAKYALKKKKRKT